MEGIASILQRASTSNNIHQLISNGRLSSTVILHLEGANHVRGVLGGIVHGIATRTNLTCMRFGESSQNSVCESELGKVGGNIVLVFVSLEGT